MVTAVLKKFRDGQTSVGVLDYAAPQSVFKRTFNLRNFISFNYRSQDRLKFWGVRHPNLNFWGVWTATIPTLSAPTEQHRCVQCRL